MLSVKPKFTFIVSLLPWIALVVALVVLLNAWQRLQVVSASLECFCPSCTQIGDGSFGQMRIDVQGAVKNPGVHTLRSGQRLGDLVASAGGFLKSADQEYVVKEINLAKELKDQDKVYIPFFAERQSLVTDQEQGIVPAPSLSNNQSGQLISINQASAQELQTLSGIGEVKSQAIIDNRPYVSLEELVSKKVLSEGLLASLREHIRL